ncbi:cytochrome c [Chloroflexus sp.]|uniref:c-type cytochrome n=1 Tax=Chloroflexus sp. TaxID=1904827 RepID=UPI002ADD9B07|nr:cytochrome c [Chloroflexus sp.]
MKRLLYGVYALTLFALLAACGSANQTSSPNPTLVSEPIASSQQTTSSDQTSSTHPSGSSDNAAASLGQTEVPLPPALADNSLSAKGDANRGKTIFASSCAGCHSTTTNTMLGPGLAGLFSVEGPKLPDGVDYKGLLPNGKERSEANVAEWIRKGGSGSIGYMPPMPLTDEQIVDLMAYLRTLE